MGSLYAGWFTSWRSCDRVDLINLQKNQNTIAPRTCELCTLRLVCKLLHKWVNSLESHTFLPPSARLLPSSLHGLWFTEMVIFGACGYSLHKYTLKFSNDSVAMDTHNKYNALEVEEKLTIKKDGFCIQWTLATNLS